LWVIGEVILGAFVLLTRGNKIIVEETSGSAGERHGEEPGISPAQADAMIARYRQSQHADQRRQTSPATRSTVFGRRH
jgi:hypothetical protein